MLLVNATVCPARVKPGVGSPLYVENKCMDSVGSMASKLRSVLRRQVVSFTALSKIK